MYVEVATLLINDSELCPYPDFYTYLYDDSVVGILKRRAAFFYRKITILYKKY